MEKVKKFKECLIKQGHSPNPDACGRCSEEARINWVSQRCLTFGQLVSYGL